MSSYQVSPHLLILQMIKRESNWGCEEKGDDKREKNSFVYRYFQHDDDRGPTERAKETDFWLSQVLLSYDINSDVVRLCSLFLNLLQLLAEVTLKATL